MDGKDIDHEPDIRKEAYRRYQLDWMAQHGHSAADLGTALLRNLDGGPVDPGREADEFAIWEQDAGFGGEIWACFDEFLGAEYRDPSYMLNLLPASLHAGWHDDVYEKESEDDNA